MTRYTYTLFLMLTAALALFMSAPTARAQNSPSVDFFYDNLAPYGEWREVGNYGYCWQPSEVDDDWHPYSDGCWVQTEAGWTWDSGKPKPRADLPQPKKGGDTEEKPARPKPPQEEDRRPKREEPKPQAQPKAAPTPEPKTVQQPTKGDRKPKEQEDDEKPKRKNKDK